jgi:hypothetical protein
MLKKVKLKDYINMAIIIENPTNIPVAVLTGYQRQNILIFAGMVGYCNINMSNIGVISGGSVVEINGVLVKSYANEDVSRINLVPNDRMFFIYLVPVNETEMEYRASIDIPQWNNEKGGYYYDGGRAVIRASKDSSGSIGGITKMSDVLYTTTMPNEGGTLIYSRNYRSLDHLYLTAGWYRYELASGLGGGDGGRGDNVSASYPSPVGGAGGVPNMNIIKSSVFWCPGCSVEIRVGGNGYTGDSGGDGYRAAAGVGGGGGGAGEESYVSFLSTKFTTEKTDNGRGGDGGDGYRITGGTGSSFGGTGVDGIKNISSATPAKGGVGFGPGSFTLGYEGYGGSGGGSGGGFPTGSDGVGVGVSVNNWTRGGFPGWMRPYGDYAAGYARIYALTT